VLMLIYLDHAGADRQRDGRRGLTDLYEAIMEGAVERVRPKMTTVTAIIAGLLPILWGNGTGASVMKRIAAPMVGGMGPSAVLTLVVIPAVYRCGRSTSSGVRPGPASRQRPQQSRSSSGRTERPGERTGRRCRRGRKRLATLVKAERKSCAEGGDRNRPIRRSRNLSRSSVAD
jgi:hypothetical protein